MAISIWIKGPNFTHNCITLVVISDIEKKEKNFFLSSFLRGKWESKEDEKSRGREKKNKGKEEKMPLINTGGDGSSCKKSWRSNPAKQVIGFITIKSKEPKLSPVNHASTNNSSSHEFASDE